MLWLEEILPRVTVKDDLFVAFPFNSGSISCPLKRREFDLPHITPLLHYGTFAYSFSLISDNSNLC